MLPSTGNFKTINCPFYDNGLCERPYCYFRHVREDVLEKKAEILEVADDSIEQKVVFQDSDNLNKFVSEIVKKVLGKKELISAVQESVIVRQVIEELKPAVEKPTGSAFVTEGVTPKAHRYLPPAGIPQYKPTPIAELKKRHIPVPYTPLPYPRDGCRVQAKTPTPVISLSSQNVWTTEKPTNTPNSTSNLDIVSSDYVIYPKTPDCYPSDVSSSEPNCGPETTSNNESVIKYTPTLCPKLEDKTACQDASNEFNILDSISTDNSSNASDHPSGETTAIAVKISDAADERKELKKERAGLIEKKENSTENSDKKDFHNEDESKTCTVHSHTDKHKSHNNTDSVSISGESSENKLPGSSESRKRSHSSDKRHSHISSSKSEDYTKRKRKLRKESCRHRNDKSVMSKKGLENTGRFKDDDSEDEDKITEECYQIFKEYEPQQSNISMSCETDSVKVPLKEVPNKDEGLPIRKKRTAHSGVQYNPPRYSALPKRQPNPVEVMQSRFAKVRETQAKKVQTSISFTLEKFSDPSSGKANLPTRPRISYVPNVSMLLREKSRIQELIRMKQNTANESKLLSDKKCALSPKKIPTLPKTVAQTVPKGMKRLAHKLPAIPARGPLISRGGRIGIVVRQKYLDALINEHKKILPHGDANHKALEAESKIFDNSSTRSVYTSRITSLISRIRKEINTSNQSVVGDANTDVISHSVFFGGPSETKVSSSIIQNSPAIKNEMLYSQLCKYLLTKEQLVENGFPRPHPHDKTAAVVKFNDFYNKSQVSGDMRTCCRCWKNYTVDKNGFQIGDDTCKYHYGRIYTIRQNNSCDRLYNCCGGDIETQGCAGNSYHVSNGFDNELKGFLRTLAVDEEPEDGDYGVYAIDCEMCYTTKGIELTRITIIDRSMNVAYEKFVIPEHPILDYNTRFSGITEQSLEGVTTTIYDVQAVLLSMINDKTILIGHGLENDLKVLRLIHDTVVDTSVVFPHKYGLPKKKRLKTLCREFLNKIIQENEGGHDSAEDARACMELMKWKILKQDS
ncbi:hypothetical protein L9F63_014344, partial [Diploptera punctata]